MTSLNDSPLAVLSGGKTAGHVFPALAVGEELVSRGWRLAFIGMPQSMEQRLAEDRGIPFFALRAEPLVGASLVARVKSLFVLSRSALGAVSLLGRLRPSGVVGTGGFVSAPTVLGAWLRRCPVLLIEPNAQVGVANRFLSWFSKEAAVGWEETRSQLRCPLRVDGYPRA